jgi:drug/metabolite transporter, DME family
MYGLKSTPMLGLLLVCLAAALWATVGVASGRMVAVVDPAMAGLIRTTLGAVSLLLAAEAMRVARAGSDDFPYRALLAFGLMGAVFQITLFAAFAQVGVTITVAVTVCAPPLIVAAGNALWRGRLPKPGVMLAIAVAAAGVLLVLVGQDGITPTRAIGAGGMALLAAASFAFAGLAVASRTMVQRLHPLRAAGLGLAVTAAVLLAVVLLEQKTSMAVLAVLSLPDLAILLYIGVAATGVAYLAFVLGFGLSRSAVGGLVATMIEPALAALFAAVLLGELLTERESWGVALMLVAMLVLFDAERRLARLSVPPIQADAPPA